jgi:histidyl-tRNA synthetase
MCAFLSTQPYKGTRDFYPDEMKIRSWIFARMRAACQSFGYQEYDGPMLEPLELYAAKSGEEIVNQQVYSFTDRGDRLVAMRPEMTPTMARMVAGKVNELPKPVRWFSIPNLWRYERPQKGRLREHWQLNVDLLGGNALYADAELLTLALDMMKSFGGEKHVSIRVNNRRLMDEFFGKRLGLNPETTLRAVKLIDARGKMGEEKFDKGLTDLSLAPDAIQGLKDFFVTSIQQIDQEMPCEGTKELLALFTALQKNGITVSGNPEDPDSQVVFDPTIMRGLDYYTGTVFEMFDTNPENRRAMFGGGRYDNLVGLFGKDKLSGVGFGMGDVTLRDFLDIHGLLPKMESAVDVFVSLPKEEFHAQAERIARDLRAAELRVVTPLEVAGFGVQLKQAVKHAARFAVLFGDTEFAAGKVIVKDLEKNSQVEVIFADVVGACKI